MDPSPNKGIHAESTLDVSVGVVHEVDKSLNSNEQMDEKERIARVNAAWEKMNSGLPCKQPKILFHGTSQTVKKPIPKGKQDWMIALGMSSKESKESKSSSIAPKRPADSKNGTSEEALKLAAAALSAVREATFSAAGKGKIQITETRNFGGQDIESKKFVHADSKEAIENSKTSLASSSALDSILEQIKKKQKLSVLDKTKNDWNDYKEENKGLEEQLDAYKKSSNQYLDKVSFLQRSDYREFERERDARLSVAKRRPDMLEADD